MDQLRKLYQRAVKTPLSIVEQIWKDYDLFENSLNKLTAKKLIADCAGAYMTARGALRELKNLCENLEVSLGKSWVPKPPTWSDKEVKMVSFFVFFDIIFIHIVLYLSTDKKRFLPGNVLFYGKKIIRYSMKIKNYYNLEYCMLINVLQLN